MQQRHRRYVEKYVARIVALGRLVCAGALLIVFAVAAPGCFLFASVIPVGPVSAQRIDPGGKGLFIIRPPGGKSNCEENVAGTKGAEPVACESEFLVGCDASAPPNKPFCALIKEKGPVRESLYPPTSR